MHRFKFVPALVVLAALGSPGKAAEPLRSTFFDLAALPTVPTDAGTRAALLDGPTATFPRFSVHVSTLRPGGAAHPGTPGSHPQEEAILFLSGEGTVTLEGVDHPAGTGTLVFLAPNTHHNIASTGAQPLVYCVVDVYPAPAPAGAASGSLLGSTVFDPGKLSRVPTKLGWRRSFIAAPTATLQQFESHNSALQEGRETGGNADPADEVIVITDGVADVRVKTVTARLAAGSFYFQAAGDEHNIRNAGPGPCAYQVLKFVAAAGR